MSRPVQSCLPHRSISISGIQNFPGSAKGPRLCISAESYAKSVEISSPDCDLLLSDNYFDLNGGSREIEILEGDPKEIRLRSVYDIR